MKGAALYRQTKVLRGVRGAPFKKRPRIKPRNQLLFLIAAKMRSGVTGMSVMRAPMASLMALVTAPGEALQGGSPMPRAP